MFFFQPSVGINRAKTCHRKRSKHTGPKRRLYELFDCNCNCRESYSGLQVYAASLRFAAMASSASSSASSSSALAAPTDEAEVTEVLKTTSMKKKKLKFTKNKRYVPHTSHYTCSVLLSHHMHNACPLPEDCHRNLLRGKSSRPKTWSVEGTAGLHTVGSYNRNCSFRTLKMLMSTFDHAQPL